MPHQLQLSIGQHSDKGRKDSNQDFHGAVVPEPPLLATKGIAIAIADGISSSAVSGIASESAVKGFLTDYYCTSETWSVKTSAQRVIAATNSWLHAQTSRGQHKYDKDKGYVCTLTVMIVKSRVAHIFHIGDARVYRISGNTMEQLTQDHRVILSSEESYLGRALGVNAETEIDYLAVPLEIGDIFVLTTDGVHEHVDAIPSMIGTDLDAAARAIVAKAYDNASPDNLTVQIVRVDNLPDGDANEVLGSELPLPPLLEPRAIFDGYRIVRQIHASSRSHIYLAADTETNEIVVIKIPSIDLRGDVNYLRRLAMEEWVARRLNSAHVLKPHHHGRKRNYLYTVMEFVDGQTLTQWMIDHPHPDLERVRDIVEQIAVGLRAFHRLEMLHQDLRPENIMIDWSGTVKIIDFGSTRIAGLAETMPSHPGNEILGTVQYTAPEYHTGERVGTNADLFSLGVIAYQLLTGRLPYGAEMAKARTKSRQRQIPYRSARDDNSAIPDWIDAALRKSVHPDPCKRYAELSEFTFDLRHPNAEFRRSGPPPLSERNPLLFWQVLAAMLACVVILLLIYPIR